MQRYWYKVIEIEQTTGAGDVAPSAMGDFLNDLAGDDWQLKTILLAPSVTRNELGDPTTAARRVLLVFEAYANNEPDP